ncbi:hypothetical protein HA052_12420 [Chromobacterium haemolyticum]|uniref:Uncharacterized protein n=1 Tax=Chromobacterium fluminis TaxID=3044269 RepID=A0ABX0LFA0_9NEIS|nr:hypothetical protein [Chromobacterium haemolyticum]NHR06002.1 hypothetical protein [Chromobacterium haemolyticum]
MCFFEKQDETGQRNFEFLWIKTNPKPAGCFSDFDHASAQNMFAFEKTPIKEFALQHSIAFVIRMDTISQKDARRRQKLHSATHRTSSKNETIAFSAHPTFLAEHIYG